MYKKYKDRDTLLCGLIGILFFLPPMLQASSLDHAMTLPRLASNGHFVATLALFVGILLGWVAVCSYILRRFLGFPAVASAILAGIVLGPSGFSISRMPYINTMAMVVDYNGQVMNIAYYDCFVFFLCLISALLTVSYLLWIAGYETDIREMRMVGRVALWSGVFGAILPIIFVVASKPLLLLIGEWSLVQLLGLGLVLAATSVSIPVAMLFESKKMHLRSSKATLAAAVIDDIVAVVLLSGFFAALQYGCLTTSTTMLLSCQNVSVGSVFGWLLCSVVFLGGFGWFFLPRFVYFATMSKVASVGLIATLSMFFYFSVAELLGGLAGITGAYFAGIFYRIAEQEGQEEHETRKIIAPFVEAILLPLFLVTVGLQVDVSLLSLSEWLLVVIVLLLAIISKIIACFIATSSIITISDQKWGFWERYLFGSAMVARGEVGLVVATMLQGAYLISPSQYVVMVVVVIATTLITPFMLHLGFSYCGTMLVGMNAEQYTVVIPVNSTIGAIELFSIIRRHIGALGYHSIEVHEGNVAISGLSLSQGIRLSIGDRGIEMSGLKNDVSIISIHLKKSIMYEWGWLFSL